MKEVSKIKTSFEWAVNALPKRSDNSNKGSFGKALLYVGSEKYMGAAHLAAESALRGGAGYVEICAGGELRRGLLEKFPEALYFPFPEAKSLADKDIEVLVEKSASASSTLVGCGLEKSTPLLKLALAEMYERKGRFTNKLIDVIWAILEESTWLLSAHFRCAIGSSDGVPNYFGDVRMHDVALFAASTGALLSLVYKYCKDILDEVSPRI